MSATGTADEQDTDTDTASGGASIDPSASSAAADQDTAGGHETTGPDASAVDGVSVRSQQSFSWTTLITFGVLPLMVVALAVGAGYLKYRDGVLTGAELAGQQSVQAATEATIAMLSYHPDNVEEALRGAQDRLTGQFRDSYRSLIDDVVIPGAKQKNIAATATVPAAAVVSATENEARVMVFVNQSIVVGVDAPTDTASAVEVTLDKIDQRWLVSGFEPK